MLSVFRGMILLPVSRGATCIKICNVRKRGKREQEHEQSIGRRGWESRVFDEADTELQDCNSCEDIFFFFSPW